MDVLTGTEGEDGEPITPQPSRASPHGGQGEPPREQMGHGSVRFVVPDGGSHTSGGYAFPYDEGAPQDAVHSEPFGASSEHRERDDGRIAAAIEAELGDGGGAAADRIPSSTLPQPKSTAVSFQTGPITRVHTLDLLTTTAATPPESPTADLSATKGRSGRSMSQWELPSPTDKKRKMETRLSPGNILHSHLVTDVTRVSTTTAVPFFMLFLLIFTVDALLTFNVENTGIIQHLQHSVAEEIMLETFFRDIVTAKDIYQWLVLVAAQLYDQPPGEDIDGGIAQAVALNELVMNHDDFLHMARGAFKGYGGVGGHGHGGRINFGLNYLIMRQHRGQQTGCQREQLFPLSPRLKKDIDEVGCIGEYSRDKLNGTQYGTMGPVLSRYEQWTTNPFVSDRAKAGKVPAMKYVRGVERRYWDEPEAFTILLPFDLLLTNVTEIIDGLAERGWIDAATQMVSIEGLFLNPTLGYYTLANCVVEFSHTGMTWLRPTTEPFWLFLSSERPLHAAVLALDVVMLVYVIILCHDVARHITTHRALGLRPVGGWEVLSILHCVLLLGSVAAKFVAFEKSRQMERDMPSVELHSKLLDYERAFEITHFLVTGCLWITWARMLEFLRYHKQLNAVTETIRLGANDLMSLVLVLFILLTAFALVAHMIYGWHLIEFSRISSTYQWLTWNLYTNDLESGDIGKRMMEENPYFTPLFLSVYIVLSWLVLLNVVLGILAAAFSAAAATTDENGWSISTIRSSFAAIFWDVSSVTSDNDDFKVEPGRWWHFCFVRDSVSRRTHRVVLSVQALRRYLDRKQAEQRAESEAKPSTVAQGRIMLSEVDLLEPGEDGIEGWCLTRQETVKLFKETESRAAESFADAEAMRQEELQMQMTMMAQLGAEIERFQSRMDRRMDRLHNELDRVNKHLTLEVNLTRDAVRRCESSLRHDVSLTKEDLQRSQEEARAELAQSGHRLAGQIGVLRGYHRDDMHQLVGRLRPDAGRSPPTPPPPVDWRPADFMPSSPRRQQTLLDLSRSRSGRKYSWR